MAQALCVDTVADAGGEMPFDRHADRGEALRGLEQRLRRNEVVLVAMHQEHRRARFDLRSEGFDVVVRRQHQKARIADDRRRRHRAAQSHMQRHHRSLAEAHQRERRARQLVAEKLGVEKSLQARRRLGDATPAFVRIAEGQAEPLPPDRRLAARLGRMRGRERRLRQILLPGAADLDQIVAVGAVAVQEHHELSRRPGARREPRTIELNGHWRSVGRGAASAHRTAGRSSPT